MHASDLVNITGGSSALNPSVVNTLIRGVALVLEIGRTIGSTIRRATDEDYSCSKKADS